MFRHLTSNGQPADLSGHTVILPSLGVGNVAQLSADLLIATLQLEKCAILWHPAIVPIVGPRAFEHDTDATTGACELYTSSIGTSRLLSVIQLRSPLAPPFMDAFFVQLIEYLQTARVARLIVLTSSYAYEKHLVGGSAFEYLASEAYAAEADRLFGEQLGCQRFTGNVIFGGGFARRVLKTAEDCGLPATVLFKYVSEGDNRPDAADMVGRLNAGGGCWEGAGLPQEKDGGVRLVVPLSWKLLFGNSVSADLY